MTQTAAKTQSHSLERLRSAARKLFVRDGYHNTRPQDVAREAGVAHGTFYLHFRDKREAYLDFAEQAQDELLEQYRARLEGVSEPRQRLRVIFDTVIDFAMKHPGVLHAAFFDPVFIAPRDASAWRMYDRMGHLVNAVAGDSDAARVLGERYDLELISHALCGMLRHAMSYAARKRIPREKLIDELLMFIDRALELDAC